MKETRKESRQLFEYRYMEPASLGEGLEHLSMANFLYIDEYLITKGKSSNIEMKLYKVTVKYYKEHTYALPNGQIGSYNLFRLNKENITYIEMVRGNINAA